MKISIRLAVYFVVLYLYYGVFCLFVGGRMGNITDIYLSSMISSAVGLTALVFGFSRNDAAKGLEGFVYAGVSGSLLTLITYALFKMILKTGPIGETALFFDVILGLLSGGIISAAYMARIVTPQGK